MPTNTDFVHPFDAKALQAAAQQVFLKDLPLAVRALDNAVINTQSGVVEAFAATTPPPRKSRFVMKR